MPATDLEISTFLDRLVRTTSTEIDCSICHEPYPGYDQEAVTDYPVWPLERREGARCRHIFGRLCIEQHVRGGRAYSTRCPICREVWIGDGQERADSIDAHLERFEELRASLMERIRRTEDNWAELETREASSTLQEHTDSDVNDVFEPEDSAQIPTHMRRMPQTNEWYRVPRNRRRGAVGVVPPDEEDESNVVVVSREMMEDQRAAPAGRVDRIIGQLFPLRSLQHLYIRNATAGEELSLLDVEDAVEGLRQTLAQRETPPNQE
jgi:hypothetical protein